MTSPTTDARTGSAFPFAANASIGVASNVVRERSNTISVERIWPGSALLMTLAAVLMASPKTRYERRYGGPKSPVKTLPVLTPTRIGTTPGASMISRSARSIRSSSWPVLEGAPAVRRTLTLPLPTSDS